jgi:aminopeptidase YwaD
MTRNIRRGTLLLTAFAIAGPVAWARSSREERLKADVARLAADEWQGRRAGTEGAERAASWIGAEFERIGLRPGAADGTYFQGFSFIDGVTLGPENQLALQPGRAFQPGEDFRPLAFSAAGVFEGAAVFAGYGIVAKDEGYDDYAGIDVKDRVVLVLRYGPGGDDPHSKWAAFTPLRLKAMTARERGARALFVVSGPLTPDAKDELVPLRADASLADAGIPAFSVRRAVADALFAGSGTSLEAAQKALDDAGRPGPIALAGVRVSGRSDVTPRRSTTRNVVGALHARGASSEVVVVGAHYDHLGLGQSGSLDPAPDGKVHHGADDNASGVAALLELARALAPRAGTFTRSLLFVAFAAEELGTLGSSQFAKDPPLPLERIVAMVNMDMVGRLRDGKLDVHGVGTSPVWKPMVDEANRSAGLHLNLKEGGYGPSDHSPFYAAGKPVFFVFTGVHADYHKPSDTAERVDAAGIARVLGLVEPVALVLATSPEPIPFTRVAADKENSGSPARGFRVWVGGVPDYSREGTGVAFSGVSPGSPAEKAGLQAGDVLVRFGPREIRNIYDYTYALGESKPGDHVEVVVKRGDQNVTLTLTLGSRPSAAR